MKGMPLLAYGATRSGSPLISYQPPRGEGPGVAVKTLKYRR